MTVAIIPHTVEMTNLGSSSAATRSISKWT